MCTWPAWKDGWINRVALIASYVAIISTLSKHHAIDGKYCILSHILSILFQFLLDRFKLSNVPFIKKKKKELIILFLKFVFYY